MAIDTAIKKKVTQDWQNAFPELSLYAKDKLYKILGSTIIGLELIKMPREDDYRPYFVVYPLWEENIKDCLNGPIILQQYYNSKNLQYTIPYEKSDLFFNEVVNSVKKQSPLSFIDDVTLHEFITSIDEYSKKPPLSAAPNSYLQACLQKYKMMIALYVDSSQANVIFNQIKNNNWDLDHFKAFGINFSDWLNGLQQEIKHRDKFLEQIEINKSDKKISKLQYSEIIL
ncbi:hypothetical protein [Chryseobacterium salviniae]|uniref:Uncharacterized protein n=1 Tax=Chryseobacterium salviniae TaxID=3101750 RepID=A0ABU6HT00_9FLAO|nr:hypothetical protein [Chryseobacterium sp. T9W2-O]MEC3876013.1 hypothetical protein [Chryseobacterium sp. T9W2-O]